MAIEFDSKYYAERAKQEREHAASAADRAAAIAHEELARLYENALASETLSPHLMPSAR